MMIDAIGKPDTFQIDFQGSEIVSIVVNILICKYHLQHLANAEIVLTKLIESDVSPVKCSLRQIIDQGLLFQGEFIKTRQQISEQLQICEPLIHVIET